MPNKKQRELQRRQIGKQQKTRRLVYVAVTIPETREVHSLEHGYIIIHYNGIPAEQIQQLAGLVRADSFKMILSPLPSMQYPLSLTAWDHLQTCKTVNVPVIRSFISRFRDHGPEQTPM